MMSQQGFEIRVKGVKGIAVSDPLPDAKTITPSSTPLGDLTWRRK
jgi:hypothetical protein